MGRTSAVRVGIVVALLVALTVACSDGGSSVRSVGVSTTVASAAPSMAVTADVATTTAASTGPSSEAPAPEAPPAAPSRLIDRVDTGGATKVVTVVSDSWTSPLAELVLWERARDGSWQQVGGPWEAGVGRAGWAYEPGEGTLRSPVGSFGFGIGFGLQPDPGYAGGWFDITDTDYWVEDPASPDYNTRQQGPADPALAPWARFEHLADYTEAYRYAALITFNVPARGPIGSGIFLHQWTGDGSTAGCVSLPEDELLTTLRWIDPASTRIIMGPESEIAAP